MENFDFTAFFNLIITILTFVITVFLIPWLKEKLSAEKYDKLVKVVETVVQAAEQLYGSGTGQQKKEYVVNYLLSKGIKIDIDEVTAIIESAVLKLKDKGLRKNDIEVTDVET